jgi:hypothetical protein
MWSSKSTVVLRVGHLVEASFGQRHGKVGPTWRPYARGHGRLSTRLELVKLNGAENIRDSPLNP